MGADDAAEPLLAPNAGCKALIRGKLLAGGADETQRIVDQLRRVHPREPLPQIVAILIDQVEDFGGMPLFQQLQINVLADRSPKHGSLYEIFFQPALDR